MIYAGSRPKVNLVQDGLQKYVFDAQGSVKIKFDRQTVTD